MIEDIYEMKNVYIICLRASNGEFFRIRRKIYKDKAEALEVVRKMNERTHCVIVPLQIGVVFNHIKPYQAVVSVIVPLQIGVVFNKRISDMIAADVIVPLQIGVVFNYIGRP